MLTLLRSFHRSLWKNVERRNVCQTHWMHSNASSLALPICPMIRLKCFGQQSEIGRKNGKVGNDEKTEWTLSSAWFGYLEIRIHKVTTLSTVSLYLMIAQRNEIWDSETYQKISKKITPGSKPERSAINCIGKRIRICFWRAARQTCQGFQQLSHPRVETPLQLTLDSLRSVSVLSRHGKYCKYCKYCIYLDAIKSIKHN